MGKEHSIAVTTSGVCHLMETKTQQIKKSWGCLSQEQAIGFAVQKLTELGELKQEKNPIPAENAILLGVVFGIFICWVLQQTGPF